ncbi:ATP synthase F1, delta subunit [Liquorilactobacillus aquaticus DSM 21051]|uniref:ATP synthase subunit delta n=2 Tax=Liquorilactobacillus aquaticus TaxID=392566 RepID=A0A0R2D238_9LACO|nr:ATP synthase F1, delta subunit [Liquorilactobacillus aquaticus DSM 21051]
MVAHRYGKALFDLAEEQDSRQSLLEELTELKKVFEEQPELNVFLTSKQISYLDKVKMVKFLTKTASQIVTNLLNMTFDYGRICNLDAIIDEYIRLNDEFEKTVRASVVTAIKLEDAQKERLASSFAGVVGAKKVYLDEKVDPEIIGGVILKSNSYIYDGSIKTKIARIKRLLLK